MRQATLSLVSIAALIGALLGGILHVQTPRKPAAAVLPFPQTPQTHRIHSEEPLLPRQEFIVTAKYELPPETFLPPAPVTVDPKEELVLTGLVPGPNLTCSALFAVTKPGQASQHFALEEGHANEWLAVRNIDAQMGFVRAILKKPCVRVRNVGAEVLLSFDTHGRQGF